MAGSLVKYNTDFIKNWLSLTMISILVKCTCRLGSLQCFNDQYT